MNIWSFFPQYKKVLPIALCSLFMAGSLPAEALTDCTFTIQGKKQKLDGNCTTDETLFILDDHTLDGNDFTIAAVDPAGDHFRGAVVKNAGTKAKVKDLTVTASGLTNSCDAGADRLRGIMFEGASGSIQKTNVVGINQGASGCQEGNAIEVRNAPFDGTHPNTQKVKIEENIIDDYQKTGIVANGDVKVEIEKNFVGSSDLDDFLAANSIQVGFGAKGEVEKNIVIGNDWDGPSNFAATAILIFASEDVKIKKNSLFGEGTDVGILALSSGTVTVEKNLITRDPPTDPKDVDGFGVFFSDNDLSILKKNKFKGWNTDFDGADVDEDNQSLP
jgi:hypothetical protein